jgi:hypothetical protein
MASRSEWEERVSEWRRSGVTAAEFCVGRGFAASTLRWYSSQLGPLPAKKKQTPERFPMVHVAREGSVAAGAIVIEWRGVRVHVPVGADESTVAAVVHALGMGVSS